MAQWPVGSDSRVMTGPDNINSYQVIVVKRIIFQDIAETYFRNYQPAFLTTIIVVRNAG